MKTENKKFVNFRTEAKPDFYYTVRKRVNEHFKNNDISPYANRQMWTKSVVMISLYLVPYLLMVTGITSNYWLFYACWLVMGFGVVGIGTSVMHDAQHGAYSSKTSVNKTMGSFLYLIGGFAAAWRIQHNLLHHTFTNIAGIDEDIRPTKLLRFSPRQELKWYHKYQHVYAWFFYLVMTLFWMTAKEFIQLVRYNNHALLATQKITLRKALMQLVAIKVMYFSYIILLPVLFSGAHWYHVVGGFLLMHFFAGFTLSCIFQPAHVMETSDFAEPVMEENSRQMEMSWAEHEMFNTANFAPTNRPLSWFIGGLNYQIEHHLFANICHVHYRSIAPIVKSVTVEYGIPYNEYRSYSKALRAHHQMLKVLGRTPEGKQREVILVAEDLPLPPLEPAFEAVDNLFANK